MKRTKWILAALIAAPALVLGIQHMSPEQAPLEVADVQAADHTDPSGIAMGPGDGLDIGDFYAWHDGTNVIAVLTFAGPAPPAADQKGTYDPNVLYTINIDNSNDAGSPEHRIYIRFGQNALNEWGVQVLGMPGDAELVGPVETEIAGTKGKVWAGLRDDPFFFDLTGFLATLDMQSLQFASLTQGMAADSFAGANITAVVLEFPIAEATGGQGGIINLWATTARK